MVARDEAAPIGLGQQVEEREPPGLHAFARQLVRIAIEQDRKNLREEMIMAFGAARRGAHHLRHAIDHADLIDAEIVADEAFPVRRRILHAFEAPARHDEGAGCEGRRQPPGLAGPDCADEIGRGATELDPPAAIFLDQLGEKGLQILRPPLGLRNHRFARFEQVRIQPQLVELAAILGRLHAPRQRHQIRRDMGLVERVIMLGPACCRDVEER